MAEKLNLETFSPLLNEKQAAEFLGVSLSFLRTRRSVGTPDGCLPGIRYLKLGKCVRYRREDLNEWLQENIREVA